MGATKAEAFIFILASTVLTAFISFLMANKVELFVIKSIEMDPRINQIAKTAITVMMAVVCVALPVIIVILFSRVHNTIFLNAQIVLYTPFTLVILVSMVTKIFIEEGTDIAIFNYKEIYVFFLGIGVTYGIVSFRKKLLHTCSYLILAATLFAVGSFVEASLAEVFGSTARYFFSIALLICLLYKVHLLCTIVLEYTPEEAIVLVFFSSVYCIATREFTGCVIFLLNVATGGVFSFCSAWYHKIMKKSQPWATVQVTVQTLLLMNCLDDTILAFQLTISLGLHLACEVLLILLFGTSRVKQTKVLDFMIIFISLFSVMSLLEPSSSFEAL